MDPGTSYSIPGPREQGQTGGSELSSVEDRQRVSHRANAAHDLLAHRHPTAGAGVLQRGHFSARRRCAVEEQGCSIPSIAAEKAIGLFFYYYRKFKLYQRNSTFKVLSQS